MPSDALITMVTAISSASGALLALGGIVAGMGWGAKRGERDAKRFKLEAEELRSDLARVRADNDTLQLAVAESEKVKLLEQEHQQLTETVRSLRADLEQTQQRAKTSEQGLQAAQQRLQETTDALHAAKKQVQLLEQAPPAPPSNLRELELEKELIDARKSIAKLEVVEKERDIALRRIRELDKAPPEDARLRSLQNQLRACETARAKLEQQLRAAASKSTGIDPDEMQKLRAELTTANDRIAVTERVMDGVRARSNLLTQELKKVRQELEECRKKSG